MYARLMILHQIFHFCERTLHPLYHPQGHDGLGHNLEKKCFGLSKAHVFEPVIPQAISGRPNLCIVRNQPNQT